jgi:hypothetical protein
MSSQWPVGDRLHEAKRGNGHVQSGAIHWAGDRECPGAESQLRVRNHCGRGLLNRLHSRNSYGFPPPPPGKNHTIAARAQSRRAELPGYGPSVPRGVPRHSRGRQLLDARRQTADASRFPGHPSRSCRLLHAGAVCQGRRQEGAQGHSEVQPQIPASQYKNHIRGALAHRYLEFANGARFNGSRMETASYLFNYARNGGLRLPLNRFVAGVAAYTLIGSG